ncbi:PLP-dependent aminotransferase family protein [Pedobacter aquatilis]|uniref:aminotransferase-like domain-containing protein n=1 Tax=Pedobacter aquatilis TaxID=351343 RepID=UPI0025B4355C|nr:PLP-dependent aminotransferase family protein [Pedobacter aquatilis]MDN3587869.1 PLP-dependent aminotransferase family protein [Pedobacter aquatilis]
MDSPVQIPFKSFIQLKPNDGVAVYLQIVFEFIKAIQMGLLPEGTKLPGTRVLCKLLNVNRNTLIKAFDDLQLQGFIEILPNKGTFILSNQKQIKDTKPYQNLNTSFIFKRSLILEDPIEISNLPFQFNDGLPDLRLVQTDILARLYVSKLKRKKNGISWKQQQSQSHTEFKNQFSNFLNLTRGLRISASNIITTNSHEVSLYLAAKLLISQGDKVVVASPSYYGSNMTLIDRGAEIITISVDSDGLNTKELKSVCDENEIRALYLSSNYHYPTTNCLSAKRRMEILELANAYGFVVIEDDHDFDFHYDNNPVLPLCAVNPNANVVYIGSFARSLPSGFGYGFITAPAEFIAEVEKHQRILEPGIDVIKEQVLTHWIEDGEVHRLAKKNKKIYKERRDDFVNLLNEKLNGRIKFKIPARGLAIWVEWLDDFSLIKLKQQCAKDGLFLPKTILYQTKHLRAIRLGFGHLDKDEMHKVVEILRKSLDLVLL